MAERVTNPFPLFLDRAGLPLEGGQVFIGVAGQDPQTSPVTVYADATLATALPQPIRTIAGLLTSQGARINVYVAADDYSIRVRDQAEAEVFYTANAVAAQTAYQPADSDLTAIAALTTTPFGRSLLTLANAAALKAATGMPDALPLTGGTVTGNIVRGGAGSTLYHVDPAALSGRVFRTAKNAADPTSQNGDIWLEEA